MSGARLAMMNGVMMSPVLTQGTQHTTRERGGQNERKCEIKICINFHYNFMHDLSGSPGDMLEHRTFFNTVLVD